MSSNASQGSAYTFTFQPAMPGGSINVDGGIVTATAADAGLQADRSITTSGSGGVSLTTTGHIALAAGSSITTVNGNITLSANQQATATSGLFKGIELADAALTVTGSGNILVEGRGGNSSTNNYGVSLTAAATITSATGTTTVKGTGGPSTNRHNYGVLLGDSGTVITSNGGAVLVEGTGAGLESFGVLLVSGAVITSAGTGAGATVTVKGSTATGGTSLLVGANSQITSSGGAVLVEGTGGSGASVGVEVEGTITSTGTGSGASVTVKGVGGTSSSYFVHGVVVNGQISSSGGPVLVEGTGGTLSSNPNFTMGVFVDAGQITSTGTNAAATVTVKGTGGNPGISGSTNQGVRVSGATSRISSSGGAILIEGTRGGGSSFGIDITSDGRVDATSAPATLAADSMALSSTISIDAGANTVTLRQKTAGTLINIGGADVTTGSPLTLGLTDAELDTITAGTLKIGDSASGAITVSEDLSRAAGDLSLHTGSTISQQSADPIVLTSGSLALRAGGAITLDQGNSVTGLAVLSTAGSVTYTESSAGGDLTIGSVDGLNGITTNNTGLTLTTTDGSIAILNTGATNDLDFGGSGSMTLTVGQNGSTVRSLTVSDGANLRTVGGVVIANDVVLGTTAGSIGTGGNTFEIRTENTGVPVNLGTNVAGSLSLTEAELDRFNVSSLQVGWPTAGAITVSSDIDITNNSRPLDNLMLLTGSGVTATAGGVKVHALAIESAGTITFTDSTTDVNNVSVENSAGAIQFVDAGGIQVGAVANTNGFSAPGNITLTTTGAGDVLFFGSMVTTTGNVQITSGGTITQNAGTPGLIQTSGGSVTLTAKSGITLSGGIFGTSGSILTGGGTFSADADSDDDGTGTFTLNRTQSFVNWNAAASGVLTGVATISVSDSGCHPRRDDRRQYHHLCRCQHLRPRAGHGRPGQLLVPGHRRFDHLHLWSGRQQSAAALR